MIKSIIISFSLSINNPGRF